jgi:tetratricopeptide (TPR) repeat protein
VIAAAILIGTGLAVYGLLEATTEAQNAKMAQRRASNALSVLRDVAKDQAMATALAGDTERTRVLLETGEAAGLDESDLGLVRALEAFVGGDPERSLELLAPVFAKEPNSVSAMGLAAIAHASVGRDDQHAEFVDRLRRLRPSTADEYLLMGRAMIDKAQSRRLVDRAFELRPTPTSLLFKAEAHILWAHDKNRPLEAKDTLRFVDAAEVFLGETSYTLFLRLMADHLLSKHTSGLESGKHSRAASKTADKLLEGPVEVIVPVYYADVGLYETALNAWSEVGVAGTSNSQYIAALLHRSEPDAQVALAHFDRLTARDAANTWVRASRLILRAEADHELDALRGEVRTLIQETKDMPQMQFALLNACFHVGDLGLQQVLARRLASSSSSQFDDWGMRAAIEFLAGEPTEARIDAALAKVASSREGECVLRCVIAQRLLFEAGHRDLAIDQLRKCLNTDIMISLEYNWASAYLHRLTTDPKWPSWINPNTREGHQ